MDAHWTVQVNQWANASGHLLGQKLISADDAAIHHKLIELNAALLRIYNIFHHIPNFFSVLPDTWLGICILHKYGDWVVWNKESILYCLQLGINIFWEYKILLHVGGGYVRIMSTELCWLISTLFLTVGINKWTDLFLLSLLPDTSHKMLERS